MQLPRESLIRDLERILEDSIRRREYYETMDYSEDTHEFLIHSLYFLGALEAKESLQKVLNLLRMGNDFTEYWFGDETKRFLFPTLYILGKNQLEALKDYALEPDLFAYDRIDVAQVAAQVALHEPERRAEVVKWFEDIYTYLLDRERDKRLIDSDFIGLSVGYVLDFRGVELLPLIGKLWEKGWIPSSMQGDLTEITEEIQGPIETDCLAPIPENITEFYSGEYKKRKIAPNLSPKDLSFREKITNPSPAEELIMEQWMKVFSSPFSGEFPIDDYDEEDDYYDEEEILPYSPPVVRTPQIKAKAKIGRNDPCPCGSGKKYKRCCWGKN